LDNGSDGTRDGQVNVMATPKERYASAAMGVIVNPI